MAAAYDDAARRSGSSCTGAPGRPRDRLLLQEQDGVAAALGYADADALMADVAAAARTIAWTSDDDVAPDRRRRSAGPRARGRARDRPVGAGPRAARRRGRARRRTPTRRRPGAVLRAGGGGGRGAAAARPRDARPPGGRGAAAARARGRDDARDALVALLGAGPAAIPRARGARPAGPAGPAAPRVGGGAQPAAAQRLPPLHRRPAPVRGGRRRRRADPPRARGPTCCSSARCSTTSARASRATTPTSASSSCDAIGAADGLRRRRRRRRSSRWSATTCCCPTSPPAATSTTRRRSTAVADAVGDGDTLELLAALTEADSLATGPAAWSDVEGRARRRAGRRGRTGAAGRGRAGPSRAPPRSRRRAAAIRLDGDGVVHRRRARPARPVLAGGRRAGAARARRAVRAPPWSADGMAVAGVRGRAGVRRGAGRGAAGRRPRTRARRPARRRGPAGRAGPRLRAVVSRPPPVVVIDNAASDTATVVEVRAPDARRAAVPDHPALADCDLDVRSAKVATLGHEVVDAFYVQPRCRARGRGQAGGARGAGLLPPRTALAPELAVRGRPSPCSAALPVREPGRRRSGVTGPG